MHGWDGEFDIKCETEFRAQGKRLGKHLSDMFPSAFDNQKGFISAKSEISEISNTCIWLYLPVQGCRVRRSCHYAIEGHPRHVVEDGGDCKRRASNSVIGILFSEFTNPCPVGKHLPSMLKVATCVNYSVHEYVCTRIGSGVTFPSFCPITAAGFQNRACGDRRRTLWCILKKRVRMYSWIS